MKLKKQPTTLFIALLTAFFFASCGGDDSDNPDIPSELIGSWDVIRIEASNCTDPDDNGVEDMPCTATNCLSVEFRSDGTLTTTDLFEGNADSEEGTYTVSGDELVVTIDTEITETTFTVVGNTLTLLSDEGGCTSSTTLTRR